MRAFGVFAIVVLGAAWAAADDATGSVGGDPVSDYLALMERWRARDSRAAADLARWPAGRVKEVGKRLQSADCAQSCLRAAVLMHTEAAFAFLSPQSYLYFHRPWPEAAHLGFAKARLEALGVGEEQDAFRRAWLVAVGYRLLDWKHFAAAYKQFEQALRIPGDDAATLTAAGSYYELLDAMPQYQWTLRTSAPDRPLEQAESCYRRALVCEPRYAEARLKYARVRLRRGSSEEGVAALRELIADAPDPEIVGFAYLFLGDAEEALGHIQAALTAYRLAVKSDPANQTARFALARLLAQGGDGLGATAVVEAAVMTPADEVNTWYRYYVMVFDGYQIQMERLRAKVDP